jgi:hypothetical protein
MNPTTLNSLADELEKIASLGTQAAAAGRWAAGHGQSVGKWAKGHIQGSIRNAARTVEGFANPIKNMKAGWNDRSHKFDKSRMKDWKMWSGAPATVGFAALDAHAAMKKEDPTGQGRSRLERAGTAAGSLAGGMIGLPHGFTGGIVGSTIGGAVGKRVGQVGNFANKKLRRQVPQQMPATTASGQGQ